jgi:hypothetical protein
MKVYTESIISEMRPVKSSGESSALCFLEGPCMQFNSANRNNRIYSRKLVEDRILNNPVVQESIKNRSMLGEGGHPENRVDISYPEVALAVEKLWIPDVGGDLLWGRFAILDTPTGRILDTLVKYGTRLGISARAVADSVQKDGHEVILENSYELITFDAVPEPGFKCARLEKADSVSKPVDKMSTKELKESSAALKSFKNPVFESRIRNLDKEICKRENKADIHSILESVDRLSNSVDKSISRLHNVKYEDSLKSLIKEAREIISEAKGIRNKPPQRKCVTESKPLISNICSDDISITKFNTDRQINDTIDTTKLFNNKDNSALEKMCSNFRRIPL